MPDPTAPRTANDQTARRLATAGAAAAIAGTLSGAAPSMAASAVPGRSPSRAAACPDADRAMAGLTAQTIAQTVRCLQDQVRRGRGRSRLMALPTLRVVGAAQARDMVTQSYFSHTSPSGRSFAIRMSESGFAHGRWTAGENLGLSSGTQTPRQLVGAWMASPPHRRNLLNGGFRRVGVGIARAPSGWILSAVEFGAHEGR